MVPLDAVTGERMTFPAAVGVPLSVPVVAIQCQTCRQCGPVLPQVIGDWSRLHQTCIEYRHCSNHSHWAESLP